MNADTLFALDKRRPHPRTSNEYLAWLAAEITLHDMTRRQVLEIRASEAAADEKHNQVKLAIGKALADIQSRCKHDDVSRNTGSCAEAETWIECNICGKVIGKDAEYRHS